MLIYIIRHGETEYNRDCRMQGQIDIPLNASGIKLAEISALGLSGIHFDRCYTSPLSRAVATARLILSGSGNEDTPVIPDPRLLERNMGTWEGKHLKSGFCEVDPDIYEGFKRNPLRMPEVPGMEPMEHILSRTQDFLKRLGSSEKLKDGTVLVSTHVFALRSMLNFLYPDPNDFWQGHVPYNCAVSIVRAEEGKLTLEKSDAIYYDPSDIIDRYK